MSDILNKVLAVKREEVAAAQSLKPLADIRDEAEAQAKSRDFVGAIRAKLAARQSARAPSSATHRAPRSEEARPYPPTMTATELTRGPRCGKPLAGGSSCALR